MYVISVVERTSSVDAISTKNSLGGDIRWNIPWMRATLMMISKHAPLSSLLVGRSYSILILVKAET